MLTSAQQWLLFSAALLGFFGVAAGAFGAHALKQKLSTEMFSIFEVGVRYQMYHVLVILFVCWVITVTSGALALWAGWLFVVGTVIFSGSVYLLVLTSVKTWGAVTPIGGVILLAGWLCLAASAFGHRT